MQTRYTPSPTIEVGTFLIAINREIQRVVRRQQQKASTAEDRKELRKSYRAASATIRNAQQAIRELQKKAKPQ
jgi:hypothetical protein